MIRSEKNIKALAGASKNASQALDALHSPKFIDVPSAEKVAWAMAAVIHCDLCRLLVALDECEAGAAKLLSMADIVSKLYEAKKWYLGVGAIALRKIVQGKSCGTDIVDIKLKELKSLHPIINVDKYAPYRNKIGYHYDADTPTYLHRFGQENVEDFYALLATFTRFSGEWAKLTRRVIQEAVTTSK